MNKTRNRLRSTSISVVGFNRANKSLSIISAAKMIAQKPNPEKWRKK
ncbi:hypothetical protein [Pollutibacter soli]